MFDTKTQALLQKNLTALPSVVCGRSLRHDLDDLLKQALPGLSLAIVDDVNTSDALGDKLARAVKPALKMHVTLSDLPEATMETVELLQRKTASADAIVAVGSGTINDMCKYVSFIDKKPYVVFPTAASMNGYASANASLSVEGYKKTFAAHMPQAVFCDMSVIAAAPVRLSKSGLGDSLARPTAQADWLLSHLLLNTAYNETPFALLASFEPELFDNARGIAKRDVPSIELLMKILLLSGFGMTIAGGSYPASQAEHMIAHVYEMLKSVECRVSSVRKNADMATLQTPHSTLHGEAIGVTTLTMARLQEKLLRGRPNFRPNDFNDKKITELFGKKAAEEAKKMFAAKQKLIRHPGESRDPGLANSNGHGMDPGLRRDDKVKNWEDLAQKIERITIPASQLEAILQAAQAPTAEEHLKWHTEDYKTAISTARYMRDRFTFLDLV